MGEVKQINIKNRTYFDSNMINLKNFEPNLLKIKNMTKGLIFTMSDTLRLKKLMIMKLITA